MMSTNQNAPRTLLFGTFQIHVDQKTLFNAFLVVMISTYTCIWVHIKYYSSTGDLRPQTKLLRHFTKIHIFATHPEKKCLVLQIRILFPPSPIAMLFAVTQEMHGCAVKPKQHCTRGREGGEFVPSGHDGGMARH